MSKIFVPVAVIILTLLAVWLAWMVNDLRLDLKRTTAIVNEKLPVILDNTTRTSQTLAEVSRDIKDLRNLAGVDDVPRDRTLVTYADSVLDFIQAQTDAVIGTEKLLGKKLSEPQPAAVWAAATRKEAVWLTFRAGGKTELLDRLTATKFGSAWMIHVAPAAPVPLRAWLVEHHPPTAALATESPE